MVFPTPYLSAAFSCFFGHLILNNREISWNQRDLFRPALFGIQGANKLIFIDFDRSGTVLAFVPQAQTLPFFCLFAYLLLNNREISWKCFFYLILIHAVRRCGYFIGRRHGFIFRLRIQVVFWVNSFFFVVDKVIFFQVVLSPYLLNGGIHPFHN